VTALIILFIPLLRRLPALAAREAASAGRRAADVRRE
jgi:hypothetical protein